MEAKNLNGEPSFFLIPELMLWDSGRILPVTYGSELLYLWIWHNPYTLSILRDSLHITITLDACVPD